MDDPAPSNKAVEVVVAKGGIAQPAPPPRHLRLLRTAVVVLGVATIAMLVAITVMSGIWRDPRFIASTVHVTLALAIIVPGTWAVIYRRNHWARPRDQFVELLQRWREGGASIEELSTVGGGIAPAVPLVQELLKEIRTQRGQILTLESEMRQRVAQRTDALERAIGALRQQAARDPLTGLFNRRMMTETLPRLIGECKAANSELCLLMADIDYFKLLNDTRGHAAGDQFLRAVAQIARSSLREQDWAFRCGGDEFVFVLPHCNAENAKAIIARITSLMDALAKTSRVTPMPRLSIGLATLSQASHANVDGLLEAADRALYELKSARPARAARAV